MALAASASKTRQKNTNSEGMGVSQPTHEGIGHPAASPAARQSLAFSGRGCVLALLLGFAWQLQQAQLWSINHYLSLLLAAPAGLALIFWQARSSTRAWPAPLSNVASVVVLVLIACMAFAWAGWRSAWFAASALPAQWHGQDVQITGVVAGLPREQEGVVRFRFEPDAAGALFKGQPVELPQRLDIAWYGRNGVVVRSFGEPEPDDTSTTESAAAVPDQTIEPVRAGDRWRLTVRLRQPSGLRNPGTFDYELWLWQQGVQATAYVRDTGKEPPPVWLGDSGQFRLDRLRQLVRNRLLAFTEPAPPGVSAGLEQRSIGVLAALVTGDQRSIDQGDWEIFRITGVAHLMAISGVHITMFAWLAMMAVGWLWRRSSVLMLWRPASVAAAWGGLLLALAYALFSGWQLPAQRTVLMLAIWVLIATRGVRWPWYATLTLAAAVVLIVDPWALQQPGFWLSFVAVGVLLSLAGKGRSSKPRDAYDAAQTAMGKSLDAPGRGGRIGAVLRRMPHLLLGKMRPFWKLQWRLTLLLIPLTVCLFGQISWSGLVANLLAIPLVSFVVTPLAMLGVWVEPALWLAHWTMAALLVVLEWIAQWPYSAVYWPVVPWYWAGAGLVGALWCIGSWPFWLRLLGALMFALMLAWRPAPLAAGEFELVALDIGQGGGMLIRTREHAMLFDAGPGYPGGGDAGERVVLPALHAWGVTPELLVLSHNDYDHTGGTAALLRAFPAMRVLAPFPQTQLRADARTQLELGDTNTKPDRVTAQAEPRMALCQQGLQWNWDGVAFEFLYPSAQQLARWYDATGSKTAAAPSTNASSCVLRVRTEQGAALLTGDIGRLQELELWLGDAAALSADWLQMPHHGSRSSSSEGFIAAVAPRFAVAQTGFGNQFRHPHPEVVQRYQAAGAQVIDSPQCGAMFWRSSAPGAMACERIQRRRYWQRPSAQ